MLTMLKAFAVPLNITDCLDNKGTESDGGCSVMIEPFAWKASSLHRVNVQLLSFYIRVASGIQPSWPSRECAMYAYMLMVQFADGLARLKV